MKKRLLFGTNNPHKLREIRKITADSYHILSLEDLGIDQEVAETEETLEGNAILKAKAYYQSTGMSCFSEDTGLEVEALNGVPGVYSARYAGEGSSFQDNVNKLLAELETKANRKARFRTVIAFYDGRQVHTFEGQVHGIITRAAHGSGGFGYDPIFLPRGHEKTFAEMSADDKNAISHRGRAVEKFVTYLLE